jgi:putative ubiquitin-RnfH superfamily antitoxin RatB of RatAB toxin-antitoxin module
MRIEVVFALPQKQQRVSLDLEPGSTALDAVRSSGLLQGSPGIDMAGVGVWGRRVTPETKLREGDRVELYRPLIADPKEVRRVRAARTRK